MLKKQQKNKIYLKNALIIAIFLYFASYANSVLAAYNKDTYPKLANYYLQPNIETSDYAKLARYDLLVLDVDTQTIDPTMFKTLKSINPNIKTFAYMPSQSVNVQDLSDWARTRNINLSEANNKNRWLKDSQGNYVYFSNTWPTIRFVDIGNGWSDHVSSAAKYDVIDRGVWDGIFYDMVFANLSWLNNGDIDLNKDGKKDNIDEVNRYWLAESKNLINKTKQKTGKPVIANVDIPEKFSAELDGIMMENFPAQWMGKDAWSRLQKNYVPRSANTTDRPDIINATANNSPDFAQFQKMRFGLTSTLMGDGYYAFDSGDQNHAQTWWYDEYNVKLGKAKTEPKNILNNSTQISAGLWRRDFDQGTAFVNSTDKEQKYVFKDEEFEKIRGTQDKTINDGSKVNWLKLKPNDGIVLLKKNNEILNATFHNGNFVRVFNSAGKITTNGFFAYRDGTPGDVQVLTTDIDGDGQNETLVDGKGTITIYKAGKKITSFNPYGASFKKNVSFVAADMNKDGKKEIITGPGPGGGPQVKIFSHLGKDLSGGFFAYDKNFRGGVNVAVADISGDGVPEIITGAGPGGGPQIRFFSVAGKELRPGIFVYEKDFRSGVSLSVGDINGDKKPEIVVSPNIGGPQIKIYDTNIKLLGQFFAYDKNQRSRIQVILSDINSDKISEILVGTVNFTN